MPRTGIVLVLVLLISPLGAEDKFPSELVNFQAHGKAPVFTGASGKWDAKIRERGWILREGAFFKMWYTGYDGSKDGIRRLGYATSLDGVAWTRHPNNPLLPDHWVEDMIVIAHEGQYFMFAEGVNDRAQLLVSKDGIDWRRLGSLDVRLKNGRSISEGPYGTPTAFFNKGLWHLFYERHDAGVWLATSKDMKVWTNLQDEPVLKPGAGDHDRELLALNQVVSHKGRYYAYYHGSARTGPAAKLWSTCLASSTDLIHWDTYPGNPLFPIQANKSSGILVPMEMGFRLYTMHPEIWMHSSISK